MLVVILILKASRAFCYVGGKDNTIIGMYLCFCVRYVYQLEQSVDQPGMVAHSWSWSTEQGICLFTCPRSRLRTWSRETGSAVPSRDSPLFIHSQTEYMYQ